MRRSIIEALTYPRILMTSQMDVGDCPMHRYFNPAHQSCQVCIQYEECIWLNSNDEFSVLLDKPMDVLFEAFVFSIEHVDAHVSSNKHNFRRCVCESCSWLRDARRLAWEYTSRPAMISGALSRQIDADSNDRS